MNHYNTKNVYDVVKGMYMDEPTTGVTERPSDSPLVGTGDVPGNTGFLPCSRVDPCRRSMVLLLKYLYPQMRKAKPLN